MFSILLARTSRPQARLRSFPLVSWRDVAINQPQVQHTSAGAPSKAIGSAGKRDGGASGRQIGRLIPGTTATAKPTSKPRYLGVLGLSGDVHPGSIEVGHCSQLVRR